MPVCNTQILELVQGIKITPGNTLDGVNLNNELGISVLSLIQGQNDNGLALMDWQPSIVGVKGGGLWADSAVGPGRTLIAAEDGNCIETMQLTCNASTWTLLATRLRTLYRFRDNAQNFWENFRVIDPVYLKWQGVDAPGPQYALIYTMDIAVNYPDIDQHVPSADVTITIEREPYWRALPPGSNPKLWTWEVRHLSFNPNDLNLFANSGADINHLIKGTVVNNDRNPNNNYLEVAANDVPGDAPALLLLSCGLDATQAVNNYFIAVRTEPFIYDGLPNTPFISTLDASDAVNGTDAADAVDATCASGNRVNITPGTATDSLRLTFTVSLPSYIGRFAIFLRAYQNTGTAGDWLSHIEVGAVSALTTGIPAIILPEQQFEVGATSWPPVYMGEIFLPTDDEESVSINGKGLNTTDYSIFVYARRTTGTSTLRFADMILFPLDEGFIKIISNSDTAKTQDLVFDNTGYLSHGKPGGRAAPFISNSGKQFGIAEFIGPELYLTPGKINRIYFIRHLVDVADGIPTATFPVRGDIIPRWRGVRDT